MNQVLRAAYKKVQNQLGDRRDWDGLNALEAQEESIAQTFTDTKTPGQRIFEAYWAKLRPSMGMFAEIATNVTWDKLEDKQREAWEFAAQDLLKSHYYPAYGEPLK